MVKPEELPAAFDGSLSEKIQREQVDLEKKRVIIRDEKANIRKLIQKDARKDDFWDRLEEAIRKVPPITYVLPEIHEEDEPKSLLVMLSDIHYGLQFDNCAGTYDAGIAASRVMKYAEEIVKIQASTGIQHCVVLLLGDMISGIIHPSIRFENKENVIQQIVGVSELVASFLRILGEHFGQVEVHSIGGNHSRIDWSADDALRAERLDTLIPWFCATKLSDLENIMFHNNTLDESYTVFKLYDKYYLCAHGDLDSDLKQSAMRISELLQHPVDYFLVGHLHVPDFRLEKTGYIRNGAVLTGGDEYTSKKRLYAPAYQVCMIATQNGVEAIYPVLLS